MYCLQIFGRNESHVSFVGEFVVILP